MTIGEFKRWLPIDGQVYGSLVEFIIKTKHPVYSDTGMAVMIVVVMPVMVVIIVSSDMQTGANIPFETRGAFNRSVNLIQAGKTKPIIPKISN